MIVTYKKDKTDKVTRVLILYQQLLNGEYVDKTLFSLTHNINERTFDRDIEDVRLFLSEIYSGEELLFDKESNTYYLSGRRLKCLDRMEVAVAAKLILESETLREDEMSELIDTLLSSVSLHDADVIKEYLYFDIQSYVSNTKNAILKFIGDLYATLKSGYDIEIEYEADDFKVSVESVSPINIVCENKEFCLIAAINFCISEMIKIPIDKILRFKKLQTIYSKSLQERYYKDKEE